MKQYIIPVVLISLAGCATPRDKILTAEKQTPILSTIEAYEDGYRQCASYGWDCGEFKSLAAKDVRFECLYRGSTSKYASDSCILYRRNSGISADDSKVMFFNYSKYLPENSDIKTDDDFLDLVKKKDFVDRDLHGCERVDCANYTKQECKDITAATKIKCRLNKESILQTYINGGLSEQNAKVKAEKERKEKREQEKKAEEEARLADCTQAAEKARARKKEIMKALGVSSLTKIRGKVVDFASNGVFVEGGCNGIGGVMAFFGVDECDSQRKFIYGSTNYVSGQSFDAEYIYIPSGTYKYTTVTGATNSVPAYKQTKYKLSEIDYFKYMKDSSHVCTLGETMN